MTPEHKRRGASRQQVRAERWLAKYEKALARAIRDAKNDFIAACATAAEDGKRDFHDELVDHRIRIRLLLTAAFGMVIPAFGRRVLADIDAVTRKGADNGFFGRLIEKWSRERLGDAAGQIAGTSQADVMSAVTAGIDAGIGSAEIGRAIRDKTGLSASRAFTVARTETHMAAMYAQSETADQAESDYGVKLLKVWLPTLDSRTRDAHAAMASYPPIPLDEKFIVGGVAMDRPGDPAGGAANCVNCRCTLAYQPAND